MAITQVGIVYSTNLRTIRRVIIPDNDAQLNDSKITVQGEGLYKMPLATYQAAGGLDGLKAAFAGQVGPAGNDLTAICNGQNQVQGVVRMDTAIVADMARPIANGWYYVQGIPATVQTGTYVDALGATVPIMQTIAPGWFYNPTTGNFGLTRNP
jgi:hypothetical protein